MRNLYSSYKCGANDYRFSWGEINTLWCMPRISINDWYDSHSTLVIGLILVSVYINIPKIKSLGGLGGGAYGFSFSEDALVLKWRKYSKFLYYPWSLSFYKCWELVNGWGKEVVWIEIPNKFPHGKIAHKDNTAYHYALKNGSVQFVNAEYYVGRREWRRRWLKFLPLFNCVSTYIDVTFNHEVGEESGSWKGGTTGCSYEMNHGSRSGNRVSTTIRIRVKEELSK